MTIQKKELFESLKVCMPGIETGSVVLKDADCFIFHNGKIFTCSENIAVAVPINQEGLLEEGIEGCVKADEFFKVVSKFPSDEIKLTITEDGSWLLKCGKAKAQITLLDFDFESRLNNIKISEKSWQSLTDDFSAGLAVCKMTANKTQLSGIYIEGDDIVSTDGNQMNCYTITHANLPRFWISDNSAAELLKLKKLVAVQLRGSWVHFKTEDDIVFSVKTLQADSFPYQKVKSVIDTSDPEKAELHAKFPKNLFSAIDRAVSFSIDISERPAVRLVISNEKIEVSSERSTGKYHEKVAWEEKIQDKIEPFTVYVDALMMEFISQRTVEFYLLKGPVRNGKSLPRLLFVTNSSKHLLATLDANKEE